MFQGPIIKLDLFFKDLLPILESRDLDLISICFGRDEDMYSNGHANIKLIEKDYIDGDGMPDDIKKDYILSIKTAMKKKANYYIENYNILQSRSASQKMKYRTSPLYYCSDESDKWSLEKGVIGLRINLSM